MNHTALILIDIQNDYFPGGALPLEKPEATARNAALLLKAFREQELPIIHIRHAMPPEVPAPFLQSNTPGADIHPLVAPLSGEDVFTKHLPSAFSSQELAPRLQALGIRKLLLSGIMTHMCVSATARAAMERGFEVSIISDACTTRELEFEGQTLAANTVHASHLAALQGLVAQVINTRECLASFNHSMELCP